MIHIACASGRLLSPFSRFPLSVALGRLTLVSIEKIIRLSIFIIVHLDHFVKFKVLNTPIHSCE